jgi:hypothetical protein
MEIERRKAVWAALAELWLDTELTPDDLERIAGVMKRSGYSVSQLREIYLFEVAPVERQNGDRNRSARESLTGFGSKPFDTEAE